MFIVTISVIFYLIMLNWWEEEMPPEILRNLPGARNSVCKFRPLCWLSKVSISHDSCFYLVMRTPSVTLESPIRTACTILSRFACPWLGIMVCTVCLIILNLLLVIIVHLSWPGVVHTTSALQCHLGRSSFPNVSPSWKVCRLAYYYLFFNNLFNLYTGHFEGILMAVSALLVVHRWGLVI